MHDARNGQIDRASSPGDAKTVGTRRRSRLPEAALGAAIIGLMLAPPQATASTSITATSDQQIEYALAAATTARTGYDTYFAAANEGCLPAAGNAGQYMLFMRAGERLAALHRPWDRCRNTIGHQE